MAYTSLIVYVFNCPCSLNRKLSTLLFIKIEMKSVCKDGNIITYVNANSVNLSRIITQTLSKPLLLRTDSHSEIHYNGHDSGYYEYIQKVL